MNRTLPETSDPQSLAERVRAACVEEAVRAYEEAGICGLCHEGRFEAAVSALRMLDLDRALQDGSAPADPAV